MPGWPAAVTAAGLSNWRKSSNGGLVSVSNLPVCDRYFYYLS
jgi:hypothetical protein